MEFIFEGDTSIFNVSVDQQVFLTVHVDEKVISDGVTFTGEIDAVTGELVYGLLLDKTRNESFEGPFLDGRRHGDGAICAKLDRSKTFVGSFCNDGFLCGTLITKTLNYTGDFGGGDLDGPIFHGNGILALPDKTVYEGEFQESRYEGNGVLTLGSGEQYHGQFSHGRKKGFGTMKYSDASVYSGNWELDLRHGRGVWTSSDHSRVYAGDFQFDHPHGFGKMLVSHVEMKGEWNRGRPVDGSGWSIEYLKKGLVYKGETKCGRPHGVGSLIRQPSESCGKAIILHAGKFISGMPKPHEVQSSDHSSISISDLPILQAADRAIEQLMSSSVSFCDFSRSSSDLDDHDGSSLPYDQSGYWGDKINGFLVLDSEKSECSLTGFQVESSESKSDHKTVTLLDGSIYIGRINDDGVMEGPARFTDSLTNSIFKGTFCRGLKHGRGTEEYQDGTVYAGTYRYGWRHGVGELCDKDGSSLYKGGWEEDKKHGKGVCRFADDSPYPGKYVGHFKNDQRHGRGKLSHASGCSYEGDWCNGVPQFGHWVITYASGSVYVGIAEFMDQTNPPIPMGHGTQRDPDGTFFTGQFMNGQRHGEGLIVSSTGDTQEGKWVRGIAVGDKTALDDRASQRTTRLTFGLINFPS